MSNREPPIERARKAIQEKRARQGWRGTFVIVGLLLLGYLLTAIWPEDTKQRLTTASTTKTAACSPNDAQCLGQQLVAKIQGPCSIAVEAHLQFVPKWTDGLLDTRFSRPTWYQPPDTLIFYGNHLLATNAFGAKQSIRYFCVVDASTGAVYKAGAR